jgi:hypothetical protein
MFIPNELKPNQVAVFKISKISQAKADDLESKKSMAQKEQTQSLQILGMAPTGDILFKYTNLAQDIDQTFGFNIKYYIGHQKNEAMGTDFSKLNSEGVVTFLPELDSQKPRPYSEIKDQEVVFQQGQYLDQYTIVFNKSGSSNYTNE